MEETKNKEIIDAMFKVGAHFGYPKSRRHASMAPYIFGVKNRTEIINLEKTAELLEEATNFISKLASEGKQILFVGGKNESKNAVRNAAMSAEMPFVAGRWVGGTFSNFAEIKKRIAMFEDLVDQREKGQLVKYTKKERLLIDRKIDNLENLFSGLVLMKDMPKALVVVDPRREKIAVAEAQGAGIPVIALSGTDCDVSKIEYPIVANDSSVSSINFFISEISKAYKKGKVAKKAI
ncbi:MAG: 30S ribosomal protein S2 [Minisyncoccia bacterium]